MTDSNKLLLAFYGDDFTGSTDALDFLCKAGIKTVLFIETPDKEKLKRFEGLKAVGIAGTTRSMTPEVMEKELRKSFTALKKLNPSHVHYKVCSTFDSAPHIGSIGKAIDTGAEIFGNQLIPLLVAAPALGRYCTFGNLFARMGIGSSGKIYRLDRHPSMSKHPTTPSDESDIRLHLSRQTSKKIGLIDVLELEKGKESCLQKLKHLTEEDFEIALLDALNEQHLILAGELLEDIKQDDIPLFSVGSSGIEMALGNYLNKGNNSNQEKWKKPEPAFPLLVVSGSCSPVTSGQINYALANNFAEIALDTYAIANNEDNQKLISYYTHQAVRLLKSGQHVVIHTCKGADDNRVSNTSVLLKSRQKNSAELYGTVLGLIVNDILRQIRIKRIVIAGGDTSGFVARTIGIEAIEMLYPFAPGAPMCKAHTSEKYPANGIEINFKGGQVGTEDYFVIVAEGNIKPD